jgi:D-glycero-beta-D-manno-heptose 1-phosphate adenylyltransferase
MEHPKNKILTKEEAISKVKQWKTSGNKVVFTNGCFDILHKGHADYLYRAKNMGNKLVIGVNTDNSVRRQGKSTSRPLQDEQARAFILASLEAVDMVVLFDEDTPLELIKSLLPDILVKGADYKAEDIVGYKEVTSNGGEVKTLAFIDGYSTTSIENKIIEAHKRG